MSNDRVLTDAEGEFLVQSYTKAFDIFVKTQPLAKPGSENFHLSCAYLQTENVDPSLWDFHVFLTALTMISAEGKLLRGLTPAERAEKERKINLERERRDRGGRRDGGVVHITDEEREQLEVEERQNWAKNLEALKQRLALAAKPPEEKAELTANDCLDSLTQGDPSLPLTRDRVNSWLKNWPADLCRSVRRRQESLRERMDATLATGVDPLTGVKQ
jgi:hypothetical protein